MTLSIILLVLIILVLALIFLFIYLILFPSLKQNQSNKDDVLISKEEKNFIDATKTIYKTSDKKAIVLCSCHKNFKLDNSFFNKEYSCFMVKSTNGTGTDCKFACIGLGDCQKICPQEAIKIVNNTAIVTSLCTGCGTCVDVCPVKIIKLIPKDTKTIKLCANKDNILTSCSANQKEEKVTWNDKKDFKIWSSCYKIVRQLIRN